MIILCVSGENKGKLAVHPLLGEKILYHKCVGGNTLIFKNILLLILALNIGSKYLGIGLNFSIVEGLVENSSPIKLVLQTPVSLPFSHTLMNLSQRVISSGKLSHHRSLKHQRSFASVGFSVSPDICSPKTN